MLAVCEPNASAAGSRSACSDLVTSGNTIRSALCPRSTKYPSVDIANRDIRHACLAAKRSARNEKSPWRSRAFVRTWRRGRDSNPRQGSTLNTLSRRAISTTHPPLRGKLRIVAERERQEIPLEAVEPCDRKKIDSCRPSVAFETSCKGWISGSTLEAFYARRKG